ncbi:MAG: hypothetical protein WBX26_10765 [Candidatus Cybelea sp.]
MTHDEIIAAGIWSGKILEVRRRMADFTVDGVRFGTMELETKSGSPNDVHLAKRISEITTAAMDFSYLRNEGIALISIGPDAKPLERPDLDARLPSGAYIGVEVADVSETSERKHEAGRSLIEVTVSDLLDTDASFRTAMAESYFALTLNGIGPSRPVQIGSKREANAIANEIVAFVRSGAHLASSGDYFSTFPAKYKTLHTRGAQYHAERMDSGPHFTVNEGASAIGPMHRRDEVIRVLDDHRVSAAGYRPLPTWIFLFLTDTMEYFHNTIAAVEASKPPITPFVRAYLVDAASRTLLLE